MIDAKLISIQEHEENTQLIAFVLAALDGKQTNAASTSAAYEKTTQQLATTFNQTKSLEDVNASLSRILARVSALFW